MKGYYSKPIPEYGDLFELGDWMELKRAGVVTPDDGSGYQATSLGYDSTLDAFSPWAEDCTHIMWFNK